MKLDAFISSVLRDINTGLQQAKDETKRKYFIDIGGNRGVNFDIAVTTINSSESTAEGVAKAGFVEVLGAKVGGKLEGKTENSQISRIQFTVFVPDQTEEEASKNQGKRMW